MKYWLSVAIAIVLLVVPAKGAANSGVDFSTYELLRLKDVAALSLSPDGRQVAFVLRQAVLERNTYDCELYVMDAAAGATPRLLGSVSPRLGTRSGIVESPIHWTGDGESVTYVANFGGHDQVWAWSVTGGTPRQISHAATNVLSQAVLADGRTVFYTTIEVNGSAEARAAAVSEARRNGMRLIPPISWGGYFGQRGVDAYVTRQLGAHFVHWLVDLQTGNERRATAQDMAAFPLEFPGNGPREIDWHLQREMGLTDLPRGDGWKELALSPDGTRAAFRSQTTDGQRIPNILVGDAQGKNAHEWYRKVESGMASLRWSADGTALYLYQHQYTAAGRLSGIYRLKGPASEPDVIYQSSKTLNNIQYDRAATKVVLLESGSTQPEQIVLVNLHSKEKHVLLDPNPWISQKQLKQPTLIPWTNKYGVKAFGYLVKPFGYVEGRTYPLVVVSYRASGFLRGGTGDEYPVWPLAANGFAIFVLDSGEGYFGTQEGDDFAVYSRYWSALATFEEAMKQLRQYPFVDSSTCAVTGLSYGADAAWYTLTHSNLFQVGIVSDSGADPFGFYLRGITLSEPWWFTRVYGLPNFNETSAKRWQTVGTAFNARNLRAPVLINESDYEFANLLLTTTTLTGFGKPFEMTIYPDAGHNINQPAQRYSIYNRNVDWLRFWLKDEEDDSPNKREQYARWRSLRLQHQWNERLVEAGKDPATEFLRQTNALSRGEKVPETTRAPMLLENK